MPLTDVEICANALIRLGAQPIQSFSDGTDISTFCGTVYKPKRDSLLSKYPWNFTMKFAQLSRLIEPPIAQWLYKFALPPDRAFDNFYTVYPSSIGRGLDYRFYNIIGNYLVSDNPEIWVKYQHIPDETLWPSHFTELMINVMKCELCYLITDNGGLDQQFKQEVYGTPSEGGTGGLFGQTVFLDSRDLPNNNITDFTLINSRFGSVDGYYIGD